MLIIYGLSCVPEVRRRSMRRRRRSRTRPARRASAPRGARGTRRSAQRSAGAVQPIVRPSAIECSVLRHGASWGHTPAVQRRTTGCNRVTGSANTSTTWAPGRRRAPVYWPRTNAPHKPAAQQPQSNQTNKPNQTSKTTRAHETRRESTCAHANTLPTQPRPLTCAAQIAIVS